MRQIGVGTDAGEGRQGGVNDGEADMLICNISKKKKLQ